MTGNESLFGRAARETATRPFNARVIMRRTLT